MINKGIFKEAYELSVAYRYDEFFRPKRKDKERYLFIKELIMDKSPSTTKNYEDFYTNDLNSLEEIFDDIKIIKQESLQNIEKSDWSYMWYRTWARMVDKLPGLNQVRHNISNKIYRDQDKQLVITICDWFLDNRNKIEELFDKVYDKEGVNQGIVKIIFEKWEKVRAFKR
jgi:predicted DNA-binding protein YlxM (UPF0122 family)